MSTNDVPGANPANNDELKALAWAEHSDGSLILVESTEGGRVIYSIFDMEKKPPIEYRDAMPESSFKLTFSWDPKGSKKLNEKWVWHDKTPFPWDRIIKGGFPDGQRSPAAEHTLNAAQRIMESRERHQTAAERVAEGLQLKGQELDKKNFDHRMDKVLSFAEDMMTRLTRAVSRLPKSDKKTTTKRKSKR